MLRESLLAESENITLTEKYGNLKEEYEQMVVENREFRAKA